MGKVYRDGIATPFFSLEKTFFFRRKRGKVDVNHGILEIEPTTTRGD
jgi:hypothetical protein